MLKEAFTKKENLLPLDRVIFGDAFRKLAPTLNLSEAAMNEVQERCGIFLLILCKQLIDRLPRNVDGISKLRHFIPATALARPAHPTFHQLPLERVGKPFFYRRSVLILLSSYPIVPITFYKSTRCPCIFFKYKTNKHSV